MRRRTMLLLFGVAALGGCTQAPGTPPAAGIQLLQLGPFSAPIGTEPVQTSVMVASSYLADPPGRLAGRPALAAQTVAQYEFATVGLNDLRFVELSPITQLRMADGRRALREAIGIRQDAPPERVIAALVEAAGAFARDDAAAAEAALASLPLTRPASEVAATFRSLPYVAEANWAASFARDQLMRDRAIFRGHRPGGRRAAGSTGYLTSSPW